ncbi:hypothetical protein B0H63DRAFT_459469 [Podospora didyma]|uniref:Uncharacterized protein n=1 Tax=Podospora didyma TaxID=330526 RepID=A0AAE0P607_9PEZI|nr:hypothetical protein B0H63DRAFT_459469 [Podospora didyma]
MVRGHLKRVFAIVIFGLLPFSTETVVFTETRGSGVSASNLSRPFLFNLFEAMASILTFLSVWLFLFILAILWFPNRSTDQTGDHINIELANAERYFGIMPLGGERMRQDLNGRENRIRSLTYVSIFFLPFSFLASISAGTGTLWPTEFMLSVRLMARLPFSFQRALGASRSWIRWSHFALALPH